MRKTQLFLLSGLIGLAGIATSFSLAQNATVVEAPTYAVARANDYQIDKKMADAETPATPVKQWESKDTGYVIFGITMGLSAALIGTMIVLTVLKKKGKKEE